MRSPRRVASPRSESPAALAAAGANQPVVESEQQERRRPLSDEDGPIVLLRELQQRRDADRSEGRPVPRLFRDVVGDAEKRLLRFCRLVLCLCHNESPFARTAALPSWSVVV